MKVLVICTVKFRPNGITSVILNYYRNIDKADIQMDFVVPNKISEEYYTEFKENHSEVFYNPRKKNVFRYQKKLCQIMKSGQYDIVHIHGNSATMLLDVWPAVKTGIPVRIVHSHNTTCSHRIIHKLLLPFFRLCYTHGFACGQEAGKWLYGDRPFTEIKNGIELKKYSFDESIRNEYRNVIKADGKTVIGHVGNFVEAKNHVFLLEWFADLIKQNNRYLLLLIGDGVLFESVKRKAVQLGIDENIIFLGKTMEVNKYLQAMDIFVLPSIHEGLPVALIEAQTAGLPCFVSDTVSREADLTQSVKYISIEKPEQWIAEIQEQVKILKERDRFKLSLEWQEKIADAGYDIVRNADRLKMLYEEYVTKNSIVKGRKNIFEKSKGEES